MGFGSVVEHLHADALDVASGQQPTTILLEKPLPAPTAGVTWADDTDAAFSRAVGDPGFGLTAAVPGVVSQHGSDRGAVNILRQNSSISLLDEQLVGTAVDAAVRRLNELLVAALLPVTEGGRGWGAVLRVSEHVPCQKGEAVILAEHRTDRPRPLEWVPPDAPPERHHRLVPGGVPQAGQSRRLTAARQRAVDDFVLSARLAAMARGCGVEELATLLTGRWGTQLEQLRALFCWVVHFIDFDIESYAHYRKAQRAPPGQGAREVLRRRRATPFGFTALLHALCRAAGLQSFVIRGNAKGWGAPKYPAMTPGPAEIEVLSNHCWIAVYISGGWHLVDTAWAAGHFEFSVGQRKATRFCPRRVGGLMEQFWLMSPQRSIADHCPEDPAWQLLKQPMAKTAYERAVYRTPAFFENGLSLGSHPDDGTVVCSDCFDISLRHSSALRGSLTCLLLPYEEPHSRRVGGSHSRSAHAKGSTIVRSSGLESVFHIRFPPCDTGPRGEEVGDGSGPRLYELAIYCATERGVSYYECSGRPTASAGLDIPPKWPGGGYSLSLGSAGLTVFSSGRRLHTFTPKQLQQGITAPAGEYRRAIGVFALRIRKSAAKEFFGSDQVALAEADSFELHFAVDKSAGLAMSEVLAMVLDEAEDQFCWNTHTSKQESGDSAVGQTVSGAAESWARGLRWCAAIDSASMVMVWSALARIPGQPWV